MSRCVLVVVYLGYSIRSFEWQNSQRFCEVPWGCVWISVSPRSRPIKNTDLVPSFWFLTEINCWLVIYTCKINTGVKFYIHSKQGLVNKISLSLTFVIHGLVLLGLMLEHFNTKAPKLPKVVNTWSADPLKRILTLG